MKRNAKTLEQRLRLVRQTVKQLTPTDLGAAHGGNARECAITTRTDCGYTRGGG
jgi:hypothetical protein